MASLFGKIALALTIMTVFCMPETVFAQGFEHWLAEFKKEARARGISEQTLTKTLEDVKPIARVVELDRKQPEKTMTFAQYRSRVLNEQRVATGRHLLQKHHALLERVSKAYDVPAPYIVALWGMETSYGDNTGGFKVIPALATLAYEGRRAEFFRSELLGALRIVQEGHISAAGMKGSWAGAMGQNQFMPSSFHAFAVDGDNDGKRDIWNSLPDVFSSTANYLHTSGWRGDERWGRSVRLPRAFDAALAGLGVRKSLAEWGRLGVRQEDGEPLPAAHDIKASIVTPDGLHGPAYLAYDNYRVIMKWNKSTYFATAVGLLADRIAHE
jgi:membrane-bound lytic murein transglycosylase B